MSFVLIQIALRQKFGLSYCVKDQVYLLLNKSLRLFFAGTSFFLHFKVTRFFFCFVFFNDWFSSFMRLWCSVSLMMKKALGCEQSGQIFSEACESLTWHVCRRSWCGWASTPSSSSTSTWPSWWTAGSTPECCWGWVSPAACTHSHKHSHTHTHGQFHNFKCAEQEEKQHIKSCRRVWIKKTGCSPFLFL